MPIIITTMGDTAFSVTLSMIPDDVPSRQAHMDNLSSSLLSICQNERLAASTKIRSINGTHLLGNGSSQLDNIRAYDSPTS